MAVGRIRLAGVLISLSAAVMLAATLLWATSARSQQLRPPESDITTDVQLLGVNDFHGQLEPRNVPRDPDGSGPQPPVQVPAGGAAYLDAYFDEYEAENPKRTIRVHAGDMVGATPLISSYFHDEPTIRAANKMEFDVGTVGNHEFDEGGEEMLRLINGGRRDDGKQFKDGPTGEPINTSSPTFGGARFPYIAANTVRKKSDDTVLPPYSVVNKDGVKVGFIGVTTLETPSIVVPDAVAPFEYLDISATVNRYAKALQNRGVESIVVLAHAGGVQTGAAEATGEIISETGQMSDAVDVVVAGHSHSQLNTRVDNKLVVEAFSSGTAFETVDMRVSRKTGDVVGSSAEIVTTYNDNPAITPDAETSELVTRYKERITPIEQRPIGVSEENITRATTPAGESAMGDLIADAQRDFTAEGVNAPADFAFMNPGGIRADIAPGETTYGELFFVQPFDNQVVRMNLTGNQIYRLLEQQFQVDNNGNPRTRILQVSGLKVFYNASNPAGSRITEIRDSQGTLDTTDDAPLDRTATYSVAANSFIATGGDGFTVFKEGTNPTTLGSDLDALEAYIEKLVENSPSRTFGAPDPAEEQRINKQG